MACQTAKARGRCKKIKRDLLSFKKKFIEVKKKNLTECGDEEKLFKYIKKG